MESVGGRRRRAEAGGDGERRRAEAGGDRERRLEATESGGRRQWRAEAGGDEERRREVIGLEDTLSQLVEEVLVFAAVDDAQREGELAS